MIKSEQGIVQVSGSPDSILFECTHLIKRLIEKNPSLITSVLAVYADELENALDNANPYACAVITDLAKQIKKDLEDKQ